jgi:hypothetical protein
MVDNFPRVTMIAFSNIAQVGSVPNVDNEAA